MRRFARVLVVALLWSAAVLHASIFGQVHGVVHDPQHRPVAGARVTLRAVGLDYVREVVTGQDGSFSLSSIPLGDYRVSVWAAGFESVRQVLTVVSETSAALHFELQLGMVQQTVTVENSAQTANEDTATSSVLISRQDIALTPGADRTNSLAMITDYVPGAYKSHDMLHMRGGHQVSWLIDGVEIPNTNISSNLGAQIDPKDIDYLEIQRGSYTSDVGDRTYGVFNVVPRTGFERDREGELVLSAGSFFQTNDQISLGDHSGKAAYYVSLNGSRSDYGLSPPISEVFHDGSNGYGGFGSLIDNRGPRDQFRVVGQLRRDFFQVPYDPDPNSLGNQLYDSSGVRDGQHEMDGFAAFSWLHTFSASTVLQVSPFYHRNRADYEPGGADTPVGTTSDRTSDYGGAQISFTTEFSRNTLQAGLYSFGQHDGVRFGAVFRDGSASAPFSLRDAASGGVVEAYLSDNYKATSWLTLIAGLRETHFEGQFTEDEISPRFGAAVRIPRLNWVFRGFYGRFYQPPPLLTASGPVVEYARTNNTGFEPLHGERDEEHQFGVQIPVRGWLLDADTFKTRVTNFLDHANLGESNIYYPVTLDGALIRAWELTLRSPKLWRFGQAHLAYSNQIAEQRGNITGGLVCTPIGDPACDQGSSYTPVDHDQRNTLNVGFNAPLPHRMFASADVFYGSGLHNGNPDPASPYPNEYLPYNSGVDVSAGKGFGKAVSVSITATNLLNRRVLLDNSLTFGGFHYNDPREIYGEVRYRFKF